MGNFARRAAPALALGGLAVVIVGVLDPALAANDAGNAAPATTAASDVSTVSAGQASTSDSGQPQGTDASPATTCETAEAVTGPVVTTRWGPVQVAATVVDGQLCEAHAVVWPTEDRQSMQISAYAVPQLDAQASVQGVLLDGVSGATYTTEGYRDSLQQLLDSL